MVSSTLRLRKIRWKKSMILTEMPESLYFRIWGQFQSFLAKRQDMNYVGTGDVRQKMIKFL